MTPRSRGRFVHEVFRVFFERWQQSVGGEIDIETLDAARALVRAVAEEHLGRLPDRDRAVERAWLLGSAAGMGVVDRLLSLEADRPGRVLERLLEFRFDGVYQLDTPEGARAVRLRGVADRIDLLEDGRLRVIDYKSGRAPGAVVATAGVWPVRRAGARGASRWQLAARRGCVCRLRGARGLGAARPASGDSHGARRRPGAVHRGGRRY